MNVRTLSVIGCLVSTVFLLPGCDESAPDLDNRPPQVTFVSTTHVSELGLFATGVGLYDLEENEVSVEAWRCDTSGEGCVELSPARGSWTNVPSSSDESRTFSLLWDGCSLDADFIVRVQVRGSDLEPLDSAPNTIAELLPQCLE